MDRVYVVKLVPSTFGRSKMASSANSRKNRPPFSWKQHPDRIGVSAESDFCLGNRVFENAVVVEIHLLDDG